MTDRRTWFDDGTGPFLKVMGRAQRPLTVAEVVAAVRSNGDPVPHRPRQVLDMLRQRGCIALVAGLWGRPELFGGTRRCWPE
jgi:hypothetical protein